MHDDDLSVVWLEILVVTTVHASFVVAIIVDSIQTNYTSTYFVNS